MITKLSQLDLNQTFTYADYLSWQFDEIAISTLFPHLEISTLFPHLEIAWEDIFQDTIV
jgi:hypothetical protein